jgi:hypothetical protein
MQNYRSILYPIYSGIDECLLPGGLLRITRYSEPRTSSQVDGNARCFLMEDIKSRV